MADNVNITAGSGVVIAADDVSSVFFQKVKLDLGTDGATAPVVAGAGAVSTGVQRITLASDDPAVVDLAAIEVLLGTIDADTSALFGCVGGTELQVDIVAALPAGTNAIGKLAANTGVDIGDVDVTSIIPGIAATSLGKARDSALGATDTGVMTLAVRDDTLTTLTPIDGDYVPLRVGSTGKLHVTDANITACNTGAVVIASGAITETNSASLAIVGGGAEATALRVTLANDSTGVITVDGTVTANLSATDNAVLDTIDAVLDTINAKLVTGTVIGDVNLGATDNAVLDAIDTVLDLINAKLVTGTVIGDVNLGATDNAVLDSIVTNTARTPITDYGQAKLDHADVTTAQVLVATAGAVKFYITSIILSVAAAGSYWIEDDDAAQITCKYTLAANGGVAIAFPKDTPYKSTTANKGLKVKGSAAGVIGCQITYYTAA